MNHIRRSVLLIGLVVAIALLAALALRHVSYESMGQTGNDTSYVCGRFGDKVMRIDRRYLFLSRVEYQDVYYWTPGNRKAHDSKGCDDQIQSAAFDVEWPAMMPSNSFRNLGKVDFVRFALHQRSVWDFEKWGEKKFFDETKILTNYSKTIQYDWDSERSIDEINTIKTFNTALELYEIPGYDNEGSRMTVYWQEVEGKGISLTIPCVYYKNSGGSSCEYVTHVPDYGYNTSYLKINLKLILNLTLSILIKFSV